MRRCLRAEDARKCLKNATSRTPHELPRSPEPFGRTLNANRLGNRPGVQRTAVDQPHDRRRPQRDAQHCHEAMFASRGRTQVPQKRDQRHATRAATIARAFWAHFEREPSRQPPGRAEHRRGSTARSARTNGTHSTAMRRCLRAEDARKCLKNATSRTPHELPRSPEPFGRTLSANRLGNRPGVQRTAVDQPHDRRRPQRDAQHCHEAMFASRGRTQVPQKRDQPHATRAATIARAFWAHFEREPSRQPPGRAEHRRGSTARSAQTTTGRTALP